MTEGQEARERLVERIGANLIGPIEGRLEVLRERPDKRYLMAMLFPQNATAGTAIADEEEQEATAAGVDSRASPDDPGLESPTDLMFQRLPASVGISFAVRSVDSLVLDVVVDGAGYRPKTEENAGRRRAVRTWAREPLTVEGGETVRLDLSRKTSVHCPVFGGRATLQAELRRGAAGSHVVTLSLRNDARLAGEEARFRPEDVLYQIALVVRPSQPAIRWPAPDRLAEDTEEDELLLQYRARMPFAVGHGCAAGWEAKGDVAGRLWIDFLPRAEVAPVTTDIPSLPGDLAEWLALQRLQSPAIDPKSLVAALGRIVDEYAVWRAGLDALRDVPLALEAARIRILARIDAAIGRMRAGVDLLRVDRRALECFRLANRAMLMQMDYASRVAAAETQAAPPLPAGVSNPDSPALVGRRWRPFQLAFVLMSLPGLWHENHDDRDIVDLIWFPTGGGKTEAYLGTAAFEMLRRRIQLGGRGGGTAILMRYTLRLLTQQQFQRAAHLICALEDLREVDPMQLGTEAFSLGLWIGASATPLKFEKAVDVFERLVVNPAGAEARNPFALLSCPCCGTRLVPHDKQATNADGVGIRCSPSRFEFFCPDARCHRHARIPVQVIDEGLYRDPPTLLLGTLDKFAMIAWNSDSGAFFGRAGGDALPPSMIIQDELHLISGPLGTIAGVYEAAIDAIIRRAGGRPKFVCSTATIRRAAEQVRGLYAREVSVFPPAGLDASDSYFSRSDTDRPGRLYLGAMAQGHTPTFSVVMAAATLLQATAEVEVDENARDDWWTLVAYHNSRRELGKSLTLARDDIPARMAAMPGLCGAGVRTVARVEQLSADVPGPEIPNVLERLKLGRDSGQAVDFLGCTNMLSVGVDVARLGLMLVVGQPKTTSEYIQATSRVGRDATRLPGVVLSLYMPTKPRDRSHYETFRGYHEALYRQVEPTSVTPYALPARRRALHAAVIAATRLTCPDLAANDRAGEFRSDNEDVQASLALLEARMTSADARESEGISADIEAFVEEWAQMAGPALRYLTLQNAANYRPLMRRFGERLGLEGRETLQSMRHVDVGVRVHVRGQVKSPDGKKK